MNQAPPPDPSRPVAPAGGLAEPPAEPSQAAATVSLLASVAMLVFAMFGALGLVAWALRSDDASLSWQILVAVVASLGGVVTSALLWIRPNRAAVLASLAVLIFSLTRLTSGEWTSASFAILAMTILCSLPVVRALMIFRP